jgi:hypothetical protein
MPQTESPTDSQILGVSGIPTSDRSVKCLVVRGYRRRSIDCRLAGWWFLEAHNWRVLCGWGWILVGSKHSILGDQGWDLWGDEHLASAWRRTELVGGAEQSILGGSRSEHSMLGWGLGRRHCVDRRCSGLRCQYSGRGQGTMASTRGHQGFSKSR